MIRMNHQMLLLISSELRGWDAVQLDPELARIANGGIVHRDQCFLLADAAKGKTNVSINDMQDRTGYECFINHIHIDDYTVVDSGRQTVRFAAAILGKWKEGGFEGKLNAIISL